jgi:hypothetical protein
MTLLCTLDDVLNGEVIRRSIDELAIWHHGRWVGEPRRIPEGADLAPRLVACAGTTIKALE